MLSTARHHKTFSTFHAFSWTWARDRRAARVDFERNRAFVSSWSARPPEGRASAVGGQDALCRLPPGVDQLGGIDHLGLGAEAEQEAFQPRRAADGQRDHQTAV